nr:MAG TPA: hypothetical protein [Caudoviricetes sp.]
MFSSYLVLNHISTRENRLISTISSKYKGF